MINQLNSKQNNNCYCNPAASKSYFSNDYQIIDDKFIPENNAKDCNDSSSILMYDNDMV